MLRRVEHSSSSIFHLRMIMDASKKKTSFEAKSMPAYVRQREVAKGKYGIGGLPGSENP
jgi:hypothetical protein